MHLFTEHTTLNGICPYFTMFPLQFPLRILQRHAKPGDTVLDPFCGRGPTNFAARLVGLGSLGVDSSPVATAITEAKLSRVCATDILSEARKILMHTEAAEIPGGEFWERAYHPDVLIELCRLRTALLESCSSDARIALRGIVLGALHGPLQKTVRSYFSNQSPRTYAPKPAYATTYWRERSMLPPRVEALDVIGRRARRYYRSLPDGHGEVRLGDSRVRRVLAPHNENTRFSWVITSPPYYGMRTYIPDQWLRNWFLGGPPRVDYTNENQIVHSSPEQFTWDLCRVWENAARTCVPYAKMVIRFGGIADRRVDCLALAKTSLRKSPWRLVSVCGAGTAHKGKRQADAFLRKRSKPLVEYDLWAKLA